MSLWVQETQEKFPSLKFLIYDAKIYIQDSLSNFSYEDANGICHKWYFPLQ
jgi:hypothetical protein